MLISAAHEDIEKHGELLPYLCKTDHYLAKVMHARLIRTQTKALAATAVILVRRRPEPRARCVQGLEGDMNSAGNGVSFPAEFRIFSHFSPYIAPQNATYTMAKLIKRLKI